MFCFPHRIICAKAYSYQPIFVASEGFMDQRSAVQPRAYGYAVFLV